MTAALGVERAFQDLEAAPPRLQGLLRPVLLRALRDPAIMRQLGSAALSQHLTVVGQVLTSDPIAVGQDLEDIEAAHRFSQGLEPPLRARVEAGLSRVLQRAPARSGHGSLSLLALARLLALAFSNLPFVEHVLAGAALEPFLPDVAPELAGFVGELVEAITVVGEAEDNEGDNRFVTIGRVLEVSEGHVLIETLRDGDERPGSRLRLDTARIVAMRTLSEGSSARSFKAG